MELKAPQFRCAVCDNVAWQEEVCHDQTMQEVCFCGSGKLLSECHVEKPDVNTEQK